MKIAVIPGDGIGPEVIAQSLRVLDALRVHGFDFESIELPVGARAYEETGHPLPESTVTAALNSHAILFGAVGDAQYDHLERHLRPEQAILGLRQRLELFASVRQVRIDPVLAHLSPLRPEVAAQTDLVIVRELAGDVYMATPRGRRLAPDGIGKGELEGFDTMRYSQPEIERVAHTAFKVARERNRRLLSVDKANVLETSRLWREVLGEVGADYPDVHVAHMYADTAGMTLVSNPSQLDTIVAPNLFGDLLTDIASILTGSVALAATAMFGTKGPSLFEPGHGSAMDIAGRDEANPISSIRAAALMLRYAANRPDLASRVEEAIQSVLRDGLRTADIHSSGTKRVGTEQMGDAVIRAIADG